MEGPLSPHLELPAQESPPLARNGSFEGARSLLKRSKEVPPSLPALLSALIRLLPIEQ